MSEFQPKRIGFFTDGQPFDGGTLEKRALGGSETALVQAARCLAEQGHAVSVFNHCESPGDFSGVQYFPLRYFPAVSALAAWDVFIVSRFFDFFSVPIKAGLKVLWNHDTLDRPRALRQVLDRIDILFVLSEFHRDNYLTRLPHLGDDIFVTRNGIDLDLIDRQATGAARDPQKVIYASRPERGLLILLEKIWPRLLDEIPELTLYLCGYQVDRKDLAPGLAELYTDIDRLIKTSKNVINLGYLTKKEYYRHLAESSLMLYPCHFPEISCLVALEAQAAGTPILTTDDFALSETVSIPEFKVKGRPGEKIYDQEFLNRAIRLLSDREKTGQLTRQARKNVETKYTWAKIVSEWDRLFTLTLASQALTTRSRQTGDQRMPGIRQ